MSYRKIQWPMRPENMGRCGVGHCHETAVVFCVTKDTRGRRMERARCETHARRFMAKYFLDWPTK